MEWSLLLFLFVLAAVLVLLPWLQKETEKVKALEWERAMKKESWLQLESRKAMEHSLEKLKEQAKE